MLKQQNTIDANVPDAQQPPLELAIRNRVIPALVARHAQIDPLAEVNALVEALLAGGSGRAQADLARNRGESFDVISLALLAPAARALDEYWTSDRGSFATVTLAVWRLRTLMRELAADMPPSANGAPCGAMRGILISTLPGEQHDFGAAMVSEFFSRGGWAAQHARPTTAAELVDEVRDCAPEVLGLSIARTEALPQLRQTIAAIRRAMRRQAPAIMIGGAALSIDPEIVARSGADGFSLCAATALGEAARLLDARAAAFPRTPPRKDQFVGLPNSRRGVSEPGPEDHRTATRGLG
jgi:MerR family transcriptional regulator, light-induced transcriptional regulator